MTRPSLNLSASKEDKIDDINLSDLIVDKPKPQAHQADIEAAAHSSGFTSREPKVRARRKPRSPYTAQLGFKVRPEMREIFIAIGEQLECYDYAVFELAVGALLKERRKDERLDTIRQQFSSLMKKQHYS